MNGTQYAENHDIRANLNILNRLNVEIPCEKDLRLMASTLYSWETESRYKDFFIAAIKDVDEVFNIAEALSKYMYSQIDNITVEDREFPDKKL